MGFDVHLVVTLRTPPTKALMIELDHKFEVATHVPGTKTVSITEHVSVTDPADAEAFVRGLVGDAIPQGATISEVTIGSDPT